MIQYLDRLVVLGDGSESDLALSRLAKHRDRNTMFEHCKRPTGSKRLWSQLAAMKEPLQFKQKSSLFVTPSKAERFVVVPPPNPSFKRTGSLSRFR